MGEVLAAIPRIQVHECAMDETFERYRVKPGTRVRLDRIATDATDLCPDKKAARKELKACRKQIDELLGRMAAEQERSLLVILQGVDASGKDGAIRKVFTGVNPQHCKVVSFKEPDREERLHDYFWRIYRALPGRGELGVFNRSHYEDAIVLQARGELSKKDALVRLRQIAEIERTWAENRIVLLKFFLHISRAEQAARFKARLDNPEKHWKLQESDFKDRKLWPKFMAAYDEALTRTPTKQAPWYIIPADHKWYRDLAIARIIAAALAKMHPRVPKPKLDLDVFKL
jgi:PPK2 family polyphosphate:nucleotide phosphotransferase